MCYLWCNVFGGLGLTFGVVCGIYSMVWWLLFYGRLAFCGFGVRSRFSGSCGLCGLRVAGMEPGSACFRAHVGLGFCRGRAFGACACSFLGFCVLLYFGLCGWVLCRRRSRVRFTSWV